MSGRTVYFEHAVIGDVARLAAVDAKTGTEAVVMGPAQTRRADLEALALRKLDMLLSKAQPVAPLLPTRPGRLA